MSDYLGTNPYRQRLSGLLGAIIAEDSALKDELGFGIRKGDLLPVSGGLLGVEDAIEDANRGDYGMAALSLAGLVPFGGAVTRPIKQGVKRGRVKHPRRSKEKTKELGLLTDYSGVVQPKALEEFDNEVVDLGGLLDDAIKTPEQMQKEMDVLIPFFGDRASTNKRITRVDGVELENPVDTQGGYRFSQGNDGVAWASSGSVIPSLLSRARKAAEATQGGRVGGAYLPMGVGAVDVNNMTTRLLHEQFKGRDISKYSLKEYNREAAKILGIKDFAGIETEDGLRQLLESPLGKRGKAFKSIDLSDRLNRHNFPSMAATRHVQTEPDLINQKMGYGGQSMGLIDVDADPIKNPTRAHETYDTQLAGSYVGRLDEAYPHQLLFPDAINEIRAAGIRPKDEWGTLKMGHTYQKLTDEWVENLMKWKDLKDKGLLD